MTEADTLKKLQRLAFPRKKIFSLEPDLCFGDPLPLMLNGLIEEPSRSKSIRAFGPLFVEQAISILRKDQKTGRRDRPQGQYAWLKLRLQTINSNDGRRRYIEINSETSLTEYKATLESELTQLKISWKERLKVLEQSTFSLHRDLAHWAPDLKSLGLAHVAPLEKAEPSSWPLDSKFKVGFFRDTIEKIERKIDNRITHFVFVSDEVASDSTAGCARFLQISKEYDLLKNFGFLLITATNFYLSTYPTKD